jgi:uncharacterized protein YjiS (DUF1127 family)
MQLLAFVKAKCATYITLKIVQRTKNFPANRRVEERRSSKMTMIGLNRETTRNNSMGMMTNIKTFLNRSQAERQLRQLDDRLLADIGVKRSDISKSVWGR